MEQRERYLTVVKDGVVGPPAVAPMPVSVRGLAAELVVNPETFLRRRAALEFLYREVMLKDVDYGVIPGTPKPSLYRPDEKVLEMFGYTLRFTSMEIIEQWDERDPFLYYKYEAHILYGDQIVASGIGIAHSKETKYAYRWVPEHEVPKYLDKAELEVKEGKASEYAFAVRKAETTGKYGKPAEYWQAFNDAIASGRAKSFKKPMGVEQKDAWEIDLTVYRVPNPQICDLAHTLSAMAQKRAAVLGTRWAVPGLTDIFEVNERVEAGEVVIDGEYSYVTEQEKAEDRVRLERAMHGSGKPYDPTHDHRQDIAELYGDAGNGGSSEAKSGNGNGKKLAPADEIRKRFGESTTGKDVPPSDADFKAMVDRIRGLKIDVDKLATFLFNTPPGGLSEAHVKAITDSGDEQLKKVLA